MPAGRSLNYFHLLKAFIAGCLFMAAMTSCSVFVKKYPVQRPFVYETNINLIGNFNNKERVELESGLRGQLDDSLRARKKDNLLWKTLKNPPAYDSTNSDRSLVFMRALLISLGYFNPIVTYNDTVIKKSEKQYRTIITFNVEPGRQWRLDTVVYNFGDATLQKLADSAQRDARIKKGNPFAKGAASAEIDRLTELFRNNGYLRFTRDELIGVWDTLDVSLLQPTLDPLEQLRLLEQLSVRRELPTVKLEIRLRTMDSARLTKYYNGNVTIYPDYSLETMGMTPKISEDTAHKITVIQYRNKFKPKIFPPNIYLPPDSLYRLRRYIRTVNRLNQIGTWQLVTIDQVPRKDKDTVDYVIRLTPAKKFSLTTNLEGSINQSASSGTLFGIGVNVGLQNRNFNKSASFDTWNARYGIELGGSGSDQFIQTQTINLGRSIVFPRAILVNKLIRENRKDNWRTIIAGNVTNTVRRPIYNQTTINGSWAYEYQRRNRIWTFKFPNIEYSILDKKDSLDRLIAKNPSLKNIFTDGLVLSFITNYTISGGKKNNLNVLRFNFESAPTVLFPFHGPFLDTQVYRFAKFDVEAARLIRRPKTSIAVHGFFGIGVADMFGASRNPIKKNALPFFKQYFAGGPNSMRAWALRRLGPGSVVKDFTGENGAPDRYGDIQFEVNGEYRFPIGRPFGIKVNGATFIDVGNVWLLKKEAGPAEAVFKLNRFLDDLAVGVGAGLRIDFNFFVIRLDYAYKVKDPSPSDVDKAVQNKWFGYRFFKGDQFQLGIGYPFIF